MMQKPNIKELFTAWLNENKFDTIIEFGTASGQLTYIIWELKKKEQIPFAIYTFDIVNMGSEWNAKISNIPEINVRYQNIFESEVEIASLIKNGGKVLLLCDNGNKILEFNTYSKYLKSGDVIMAHDYSPSTHFWENNKYWNWLEITDEDIKDSINKNGLIPYKNDISLQYAWCSFKKL
jgi:hypothetical protein